MQRKGGRVNNMTIKRSLGQLAFYASRPHACEYLPGRESASLFADPDAAMDMGIYSELANLGFRRSGAHVYRPHCESCQACVPMRVPVAGFRPSRAQRRCVSANEKSGVRAVIRDASFDEAHFALYRRYISSRHAGGGMDDPSPERYVEFLSSPWSETLFVEFRQQETLIAVSVLDVLAQGLSAVYTFFDPAFAALSPGRHGVLWAIAEARRRGLTYLYLGYWINGCAKMQYKQEYRPLELFLDGRWPSFDRHDALPG